MAKPWAKYEIGFINHRKFSTLPANAICLWLEGKNYADLHHTDGLLPVGEVKRFRFYSTKMVDRLMRSAGPKTPDVDAACFAPLWEAVPGIGWKMHDYLDHNDCRDAVIQRCFDRQVAAGRAQEVTKERLQRWRAAKKTKATQKHFIPEIDTNSGTNSDESAPNTGADHGDKYRATVEIANQSTHVTPDVTLRKRSGNALHQQQQQISLRKAQSESDPVEFDLAAKGFLGWFRAQYKLAMHADYLVPPKKDAPIVRAMLRTVDMRRLEQLTALLFVPNIDDDWIRGSDRGISILQTKLNWLNQRLGAFEAKQQAERAHG